MNFEQIIRELQNKVYRPIYLLTGDEPYYIDKVVDYISENVLDEAERDFNQVTLYGRDTDVDTLVENAKRYPMMANHQVVILKEAQYLRNIERLSHYAQNPLKTTILVVAFKHKKLDKRKKEVKALLTAVEKHGTYFESSKLYDNKIPDWVINYTSKNKYHIDLKSAVVLSEFLGNDLSKIANELDKLMLNLEEGAKIDSNFIEKNIGISKDYNNFELQAAIGKKELLKANRIVNYFSENSKSNPLVVTLGTLYAFFSKLLMYHYLQDKSKNSAASTLRVNPYFINDYQTAARNYNIRKTVGCIHFLREYDLKSKGMNNSSTGDGELLKELIYKILH